MNTTNLTAATVRTAIAAIFEMEMQYTSNKVFVADLYNVCGAMLGLFSGSLEEFKTQLLALHRAREIVLAKIDLPLVVWESHGRGFYERCIVAGRGFEYGLVAC